MRPMTRRASCNYGLGAGAALTLPWAARVPVARAAQGGKLAKYLQPLPLPGAGIVVATPSGPNQYSFTQTQITRQLHPDLPPTPLWAYDDGSGLGGQAGSFGMAVVAQSGTPLTVTTRMTSRRRTRTGSRSTRGSRRSGNEVRLMTHLHGGFVAADSDGNPAVTPNGFGPGETQSVFYTNQLPQMPASLLWFHDHGLGTTRLNVFAGLAAALHPARRVRHRRRAQPHRDPRRRLRDPARHPGPPVQPRRDVPVPDQRHRRASPGSGSTSATSMLVNGKVWPFLNVEPRMYRFRILNGCNARILSLDIGGPGFWQIGAEGGMFDVPVPVKKLVLAPAERADVLVDFTKFAGRDAGDEEPQAAEAGVEPGALRSSGHADPGRDDGHAIRAPPSIPSSLPGPQGRPERPGHDALHHPQRDRPGRADLVPEPERRALRRGPATETPKVGTVEDWVYVNMTGDTHPMHMHLVTFQVIGRTPFDVEAYEEAYGGPNGVPGGIDPTPFATGPMLPPAPRSGASRTRSRRTPATSRPSGRSSSCRRA